VVVFLFDCWISQVFDEVQEVRYIAVALPPTRIEKQGRMTLPGLLYRVQFLVVSFLHRYIEKKAVKEARK